MCESEVRQWGAGKSAVLPFVLLLVLPLALPRALLLVLCERPNSASSRADPAAKEEFGRLMAKTGTPVLAVVDLPPLPRTVSRPLVDPVPLSPVSMVWRKGLAHPGLDALRRAVAELAGAEVWLSIPEEGWIPARDALIMMSFS